VPLDLSLPRAMGVVPISDGVGASSLDVTRTIVLGIGTGASSSSAPVVPGGSTKGPIVSCAVPGGVPSDYGAPPILSFTDATGSGATAVAICGIGTVFIIAGGSGYTGATEVTLRGGDLAPDGAPATLLPIIGGLGAITGVNVTSRGSGYNTFAEVIFTDSGGGSGAIAYAALKPVAITMYQQGEGYTAPTLVITPFFRNCCPDSDHQEDCFRNWMTQILQEGAQTSVSAAVPVVS